MHPVAPPAPRDLAGVARRTAVLLPRVAAGRTPDTTG